MFEDFFGWNDERQFEQDSRFMSWMKTVKCPVLIECGAGTAIPRIRKSKNSVDAVLIDESEPNIVKIETKAKRTVMVLGLFYVQALDQKLIKLAMYCPIASISFQTKETNLAIR